MPSVVGGLLWGTSMRWNIKGLGHAKICRMGDMRQYDLGYLRRMSDRSWELGMSGGVLLKYPIACRGMGRDLVMVVPLASRGGNCSWKRSIIGFKGLVS